MFTYSKLYFHLLQYSKSRYFVSRFLTWDANSIFDIKSLKNEGCDAFPGSLSFDGIVHVMFLLLQNAETQIKRSYSDVLDAAMKRPVFG